MNYALVVIGASWGGLRAVKEVLDGLGDVIRDRRTSPHADKYKELDTPERLYRKLKK
jgi:hypothetical protein